MKRLVVLLMLCISMPGCRPAGDNNRQDDANTDSRESPRVPSGPASNVADLLPVGETRAMLLELQPPEDIVILSQKMAESIAGHPDWIESYTGIHSQLPAGESLPYHENFGITAEEYKLLCETLDRTPLTPSVPCTLKVEEADDGQFLISVSGDSEQMEGMSGLLVDANSMSVTFDGITATSWRESESPPGAPFRVDGVSWKTELANPDRENFETLWLRLGSNLKNGNGILMFRVFHVVDGEVLSQGELNVEWPR